MWTYPIECSCSSLHVLFSQQPKPIEKDLENQTVESDQRKSHRWRKRWSAGTRELFVIEESKQNTLESTLLNELLFLCAVCELEKAFSDCWFEKEIFDEKWIIHQAIVRSKSNLSLWEQRLETPMTSWLCIHVQTSKEDPLLRFCHEQKFPHTCKRIYSTKNWSGNDVEPSRCQMWRTWSMINEGIGFPSEQALMRKEKNEIKNWLNSRSA